MWRNDAREPLNREGGQARILSARTCIPVRAAHPSSRQSPMPCEGEVGSAA